METTINDRFAILIKKLGYRPAAFAAKIEVHPNQLYNIIRGRNSPSYDLIVKIFSQFPQISMRWFFFGDGDMLDNTFCRINEFNMISINRSKGFVGFPKQKPGEDFQDENDKESDDEGEEGFYLSTERIKVMS